MILCRVKRATSKTTKDLTRMFIIPRSFIHCRAKRASRYTRYCGQPGGDFVSVIARVRNSEVLEKISYRYTSQTSSFCQLIEGRLHSANLLLSKNQTLLTNEIYYRL